MTIIDGHVHVYPCFEAGVLLGSAWWNTCAVGAGGDSPPVLLLTESQGHDCFAQWQRAASGPLSEAPGWTVSATGEDVSLRVDGPDGARLLVVAGRQIACEERLEVLALGFGGAIEDGRPIRDVLAAVRAAGALAVIPWGAGKWLGRRGRLVKDLLDLLDPAGCFLGDNAGRPIGWPRPAVMRAAEQRGIRVLPGSDPLPFAGEERTVGRCGFRLACDVDAERPMASLREALARGDVAVEPYGPRECPLRFIRNQVKMQLKQY